MEFGYTIPLQRHLNLKPPSPAEDAAPFFCWDIHMLTVQNRKTALALNRASRYCILLYGMGGLGPPAGACAGRNPGGHSAGGAFRV